ncbi:MAG: hypothetical protein E7115_09445 [Bacteroidales bacterium]|nr:hypothetical protein [Bacteroidales bacterium]MBE6241702.1 hypothetical protein [Bacteroidales bacterium]
MKTSFKFSRVIALVIAIVGLVLTTTSCDPESLDAFVDGFYDGYYGTYDKAQSAPNGMGGIESPSDAH